MGIATVSTTHGFRRGDGCSGSAIKGVKVLTARSQCRGATAEEDRAVTTLQRDAGVGEGFLILSAGYDQRLSIWRPLSSILNISQPHYSKSLCRSSQDSSEAACERPTPTDQRTNGHSMDSVIIMQHRDSLLEWRAGMPIHVGDVCALDALMIHTQEPGQDSCNAGTSPLRSEGMSSLRADDSQTKSTAQAPQGKVSEIAIIVVGEGYQVFTAVLQNHDNRDSGGSR